MQHVLTVCIMLLGGLSLLAQNTWVQDGPFKRFEGESAITSKYLGSSEAEGYPIVEQQSSITQIDLITGAVTPRDKPAQGSWVHLPRAPTMLVSAVSSDGATAVSFNDVWLGQITRQIQINQTTDGLEVDPTDTWIASDQSVGAIVFAPTPFTPDDQASYLIVVFKQEQVTFTLRVKAQNDIDIYVRPDLEYGVLVYLRGNGLTFPPSIEEVFTNGGYLRYEPDGRRTTMGLPTRGPGGGKGRKIIWHSNKADRLLMTDENASGALLIKASNGIVVDSIISSKLFPGKRIKILSASGNQNETWMATHAQVDDQSAIVLWSMPLVVEGSAEFFTQGDQATKQMPLSPWDIIIPFISSTPTSNVLYSWDRKDLVSVEEQTYTTQMVSPLPASEFIRIAVTGLNATVQYRVISADGAVNANGSALAFDGECRINVSDLACGVYSIAIEYADTVKFARFIVSR